MYTVGYIINSNEEFRYRLLTFFKMRNEVTFKSFKCLFHQNQTADWKPLFLERTSDKKRTYQRQKKRTTQSNKEKA